MSSEGCGWCTCKSNVVERLFPAEIYARRRAELARIVGDGIILIPGNGEAPRNYAKNAYRYRQDSNFIYLFGHAMPGLHGLIDASSGESILLGDDPGIEDIIWTGPQESVASLAARVGVARTEPSARLSGHISSALAAGRAVHFAPPYRAEVALFISRLLNLPVDRLAPSAKLISALVAMRSEKDDLEIAEIERAIGVAHDMFLMAMRAARPGLIESEVAGIVEGVAFSNGCDLSFGSICSVHGEIFHNPHCEEVMRDGDLLLIDAGIESTMGYCTDHTRTLPVSGRFTERQRGIYEIVLSANRLAIAAIRPGVRYRDVHLMAARRIAEGLANLGLMRGDPEEAVRQGAHALFFPHGLGHMLGLDAHDMESLGEEHVGYDGETKRSDQFGTAYLRLGRELRERFVLTVEPGIYFIPALIDAWRAEGRFCEFIDYAKVEEFKGFGGIRIEDDILVTEDGCRVMGKPISKSVEEVEAVMGR